MLCVFSWQIASFPLYCCDLKTAGKPQACHRRARKHRKARGIFRKQTSQSKQGKRPSRASSESHFAWRQGWRLPAHRLFLDTRGNPPQQTTISSKYIPGTQLVFSAGGMINWACIIQGQNRLEHKLCHDSFQLPDRRRQTARTAH